MRALFGFTLIIWALTARSQTFTVSIAPTATNFCTNRDVRFVAVSDATPATYSWSVAPSKGVKIFPNTSDESIIITFPSPLVYTLSVRVTSGSVSVVDTRLVPVARTPVAAFNASLVAAGYPNQLQLTNYSTGYTDSYWTYSDVPQIDTAFNSVKYYTSSGNYEVTLVAIGANGCDDASHYQFRIADSSSVILPNVFTPNEDGVNDLYRPLTTGISELNAWVYSRYGTLIASWDKVNGFWDGRTIAGEPCTAGNYFIVMNAKGFDGRNYQLKSAITLLR